MDTKAQFKNIILRADGKLNIRTFNVKYFEKHNYMKLWEDFTNSTSNLEYLPMFARSILYLAGIETLDACYCGKPVTILDRKISKFCSRKCGYKSCERSEATSKRMKDHADEYLDKRKKTMKEKYGHEFNFQRESVKEKISAPRIPLDKAAILTDYNWCYQKYMIDKLSATDIGAELGVNYGAVIGYLRKHGWYN